MNSILNVHKPPVKLVVLCNGYQLLCKVCDVVTVQELVAGLCPFLPLSDERPHGEHSVPVSSVGPAGRRDGDEVMAEVHKGIHLLPVVEIVVLHVTAPLNIFIICVPTHTHTRMHIYIRDSMQ